MQTADSSSSTTTTTTTTNTTIPISVSDVISRSIHNISSFLSHCRPWHEFMATGIFESPESLSFVTERLHKNARYFRLNYAILVYTCALLSLLEAPFTLLLVVTVSALWLILYVFREDDPLVLPSWWLGGHCHVTDHVVLVGLASVSIATLWFTGCLEKLIYGAGVGVLISAIHGAFRNLDGLFLNEDEAASSGLIGSKPH